MKKPLGTALFSVALALLVYFLLPASCPEPARRTFFVFVIAALFWALEVIPLHATSIVVVLLLSFLLGKRDATFFRPFANPVIILFLGGLFLAQALHKHRVDRVIASRLMAGFGERPYPVLLGFMGVTALISMWMSNTATTALMLAMIQPLLASLDRKDPFRKALVLAVAFAANIGGIGTPVGTPPNAIALAFLAERGIRVSFFSWMARGTPIAFLLVLVTSQILYRLFPPLASKISLNFLEGEGLTRKSLGVSAVAVFTIFLWLSSPWHGIPESLVALIAMGLLTSLGLFDRDDVRRVEWDVMILVWGGLALGEGMEASGLATWLVAQPLFSQQGFLLVVLFSGLAIFLSTFMSNSATSNLLLPLAMSATGASPAMLAMVVAFSSSFDLALPISTPPMAMAYATREVSVKEMLKAGIFFTMIANALVLASFRVFP